MYIFLYIYKKKNTNRQTDGISTMLFTHFFRIDPTTRK